MNDLLAWVLTYLIHSTVLIGGVWLLLRCCELRSNAIRETLWTVALFGGVLTATVQTVTDVDPAFGSVSLNRFQVAVDPAPDPASEAVLELATIALSDTILGPEPDLRVAEGDAPLLGITTTHPGGAAAPTVNQPVRPSGSEPALSRSVSWRGAGVITLVALLGLLGWAVLRLCLALTRRRELRQGTLVDLLDQVRQRQGVRRPVRLTVSERLGSPVALGLSRWEICVPRRALDQLTERQQEGMLAHELAHLVRRDPLRLLLCRAVETLLFFQPLNRLARRRLFETIECRCDAKALSGAGSGVALASCLTEVAGWMTENRTPLPSVAMAQRGSSLTRRVERLLDEKEALAADRRGRFGTPFLTLALPLLVLLAPVVSSNASEAAVVGGWAALESSPATSVTERITAEDSGSAGTDRSLLVAEAASLLEEEIDLLSAEMADLYARLPPSREIPTPLLRTLGQLAERVNELGRQRWLLTGLKTRLLREQGLEHPRNFAR